jgi:hypothetical protein
MQGKTQRLVELDFFRGLVLLVIVVDHIGGSMLSRVTLHAFALNDAAEVFVFLGGFALLPPMCRWPPAARNPPPGCGFSAVRLKFTARLL